MINLIESGTKKCDAKNCIIFYSYFEILNLKLNTFLCTLPIIGCPLNLESEYLLESILNRILFNIGYASEQRNYFFDNDFPPYNSVSNKDGNARLISGVSNKGNAALRLDILL